MNTLTQLDIILIGGYLASLTILGLLLKRQASQSIEDYLVGGRKIPWWLLGVSGMGNYLDLTGTALVVSFLFMMGPLGLFVEFRGGVLLPMVFMMLWTGKWSRRSGCLTGSEWITFRFGDQFGARFAQAAVVLSALVGAIGMIALMIIGVGSFLSAFLPFSPTQCAFGLVLFATLYTMLSGFYGVVYTDLFQTTFIIAAVIYVSYLAFGMVEDASSLQEIARQVTGNPGWGEAVPKWETYMPRGYEPYKYLLLYAFFYLLRNVIGGLGTGSDPKYFAAKSDRECGQLTLLWISLMTLRWPLMIGIAIIGIMMVSNMFPGPGDVSIASDLIRNRFPDVAKPGWGTLIAAIVNSPETFDQQFIGALKDAIGGGDDWRSKVQLIGFDGTINPERILPMVVFHEIPSGVKGLIIVALIAASMSTFDSNLNMTAGMVIRDVYQKYLRPEASTKELIYASWGTIVLIVAGAFAFALTISSINDIWGWIVMGLGGGLLVPSVLRFYWARFNGSGFAIGTVVGLVTAVGQRALVPEASEIWIFAVTLTAGLIGSIVGTLLTEPTDSEVLENFYIRTRPFGFWADMKEKLSPARRLQMEWEHKTEITAVPFALVWQVCLFYAPMLALTKYWEAFWAVTAIGGVAFGGLYYFWLRHLISGPQSLSIKQSSSQ